MSIVGHYGSLLFPWLEFYRILVFADFMFFWSTCICILLAFRHHRMYIYKQWSSNEMRIGLSNVFFRNTNDTKLLTYKSKRISSATFCIKTSTNQFSMYVRDPNHWTYYLFIQKSILKSSVNNLHKSFKLNNEYNQIVHRRWTSNTKQKNGVLVTRWSKNSLSDSFFYLLCTDECHSKQ